MLENNGHYLRAKIISDQQATEIVRLQDALTSHAKENNDLKIVIQTLR